MKKLLRLALLLLLLGALGLLPFHSSDVAKLLPVKTVVVMRSGEEWVVDVGAGVRAVGQSLSQALERLREAVTGEVFFPTAEQVILTDDQAETVEAVTEEPAFRPAAGIYLSPEESPDPLALGEYLASHSSNITILDVRAALAAGESPHIPVVAPAEGGYLVYGGQT